MIGVQSIGPQFVPDAPSGIFDQHSLTQQTPAHRCHWAVIAIKQASGSQRTPNSRK